MRKTYENTKWIPETAVYLERRVSRKTGRKVLDSLIKDEKVDVVETSTNRRWLDFKGAKKLANAL